MVIRFDDLATDNLIAALQGLEDALWQQSSARYSAAADMMEEFKGRYAALVEAGAHQEAIDRNRLRNVADDLVDQLGAARRKAHEERQRLKDLAAWEEREERRRTARNIAHATGGALPAYAAWDVWDPKPSEFRIVAAPLYANFRVGIRPRSGGYNISSGVSSADPETITHFTSRSRVLDRQLDDHFYRVRTAWHRFETSCSWVPIERVTLAWSLQEWLSEADVWTNWVSQIGAAFQAAGAEGQAGPVSVQNTWLAVFANATSGVRFGGQDGLRLTSRSDAVGAALYAIAGNGMWSLSGWIDAVKLLKILQGFAEGCPPSMEAITELSDDELRLLGAIGLLHHREGYWQLLAALDVETLNRLRRVTEGWFEPDLGSADDDAKTPGGKTAWQQVRDNGATWKTVTNPTLGSARQWTQISQGRYGDCWFISPLGLIVRDDPNWVSQHVRINPNGTITVEFKDQAGKWVPVTVSADTNRLGADGPGWMMYAEKAAAEFYNQDRSGYPPGTYAAIESDHAANAIAMLSDRQTRWIDASLSSVKELKTAIRQGSSVIVSTQKRIPKSFKTAKADPNNPQHQQKYVPSHAYLLDPDSVTEEGFTLINPHGFDDEGKNLTISWEQFPQWAGGATIVEPQDNP